MQKLTQKEKWQLVTPGYATQAVHDYLEFMYLYCVSNNLVLSRVTSIFPAGGSWFLLTRYVLSVQCWEQVYPHMWGEVFSCTFYVCDWVVTNHQSLVSFHDTNNVDDIGLLQEGSDSFKFYLGR